MAFIFVFVLKVIEAPTRQHQQCLVVQNITRRPVLVFYQCPDSPHRIVQIIISFIQWLEP